MNRHDATSFSLAFNLEKQRETSRTNRGCQFQENERDFFTLNSYNGASPESVGNARALESFLFSSLSLSRWRCCWTRS